jgi:HEAT repeat protein
MAEAMLRLDGNHVTATDTLVGMVSSKANTEERMMAAFAMQSATVVQRERCISTLIKALDDSESDVRAAAALTLGAYGPSAKTALPELVRLVHDENEDTARAAGIALQCIEPPPASAQVDTRVTPVSAGADHGQ